MSLGDSEAELRLVARSFSAVGHELAGPLQTALNALFVLERQKGAVPPEWGASLRTIESAVETLRARLDRLLLLPQALHATRQQSTVGAVIERALLQLGPAASRVHVASPGTATVWLDATNTALALGELLLNALEAAPAGASVSLTSRLEGGAFVARISNPGPALPQAAMDPFCSLHAKTLGLGLTVARAVALSHGGALHFVHEEGISAVTLTIPDGPQ